MNSVLFYFVPLMIYAIINNLIDHLYWPYYVVLLLAFLGFQLSRLRYPKDAVPPIAKVTQAVFYILTVAFIFRDQYLNPLTINVLLGASLAIAMVEIRQYRRKTPA